VNGPLVLQRCTLPALCEASEALSPFLRPEVVRSQRELDSQVIPWLGWKEVTPHLDESDWMSSYAGSHSAFSECRLPFSVIHINRVHRAVRDLCKRRCSLCIESSHCLCSGDPEPSIRYTSVFNILGLQSQLVKFGPQLYQALHTLQRLSISLHTQP